MQQPQSTRKPGCLSPTSNNYQFRSTLLTIENPIDTSQDLNQARADMCKALGHTVSFSSKNQSNQHFDMAQPFVRSQSINWQTNQMYQNRVNATTKSQEKQMTPTTAQQATIDQLKAKRAKYITQQKRNSLEQTGTTNIVSSWHHNNNGQKTAVSANLNSKISSSNQTPLSGHTGRMLLNSHHHRFKTFQSQQNFNELKQDTLKQQTQQPSHNNVSANSILVNSLTGPIYNTTNSEETLQKQQPQYLQQKQQQNQPEQSQPPINTDIKHAQVGSMKQLQNELASATGTSRVRATQQSILTFHDSLNKKQPSATIGGNISSSKALGNPQLNKSVDHNKKVAMLTKVTDFDMFSGHPQLNATNTLSLSQERVHTQHVDASGVQSTDNFADKKNYEKNQDCIAGSAAMIDRRLNDIENNYKSMSRISDNQQFFGRMYETTHDKSSSIIDNNHQKYVMQSLGNVRQAYRQQARIEDDKLRLSIDQIHNSHVNINQNRQVYTQDQYDRRQKVNPCLNFPSQTDLSPSLYSQPQQHQHKEQKDSFVKLQQMPSTEVIARQNAFKKKFSDCIASYVGGGEVNPSCQQSDNYYQSHRQCYRTIQQAASNNTLKIKKQPSRNHQELIKKDKDSSSKSLGLQGDGSSKSKTWQSTTLLSQRAPKSNENMAELGTPNLARKMRKKSAEKRKRAPPHDMWQYIMQLESRVDNQISEINQKQDEILSILKTQNKTANNIEITRQKKIKSQLQTPQLSDFQNKPIQIETSTPSNLMSPNSVVSGQDPSTFTQQYQIHLNSLNKKMKSANKSSIKQQIVRNEGDSHRNQEILNKDTSRVNLAQQKLQKVVVEFEENFQSLRNRDFQGLRVEIPKNNNYNSSEQNPQNYQNKIVYENVVKPDNDSGTTTKRKGGLQYVATATFSNTGCTGSEQSLNNQQKDLKDDLNIAEEQSCPKKIVQEIENLNLDSNIDISFFKNHNVDQNSSKQNSNNKNSSKQKTAALTPFNPSVPHSMQSPSHDQTLHLSQDLNHLNTRAAPLLSRQRITADQDILEINKNLQNQLERQLQWNNNNNNTLTDPMSNEYMHHIANPQILTRPTPMMSQQIAFDNSMASPASLDPVTPITPSSKQEFIILDPSSGQNTSVFLDREQLKHLITSKYEQQLHTQTGQASLPSPTNVTMTQPRARQNSDSFQLSYDQHNQNQEEPLMEKTKIHEQLNDLYREKEIILDRYNQIKNQTQKLENELSNTFINEPDLPTDDEDRDEMPPHQPPPQNQKHSNLATLDNQVHHPAIIPSQAQSPTTNQFNNGFKIQDSPKKKLMTEMTSQFGQSQVILQGQTPITAASHQIGRAPQTAEASIINAQNNGGRQSSELYFQSHQQNQVNDNNNNFSGFEGSQQLVNSYLTQLNSQQQCQQQDQQQFEQEEVQPGSQNPTMRDDFEQIIDVNQHVNNQERIKNNNNTHYLMPYMGQLSKSLVHQPEQLLSVVKNRQELDALLRAGYLNNTQQKDQLQVPPSLFYDDYTYSTVNQDQDFDNLPQVTVNNSVHTNGGGLPKMTSE